MKRIKNPVIQTASLRFWIPLGRKLSPQALVHLRPRTLCDLPPFEKKQFEFTAGENRNYIDRKCMIYFNNDS